MSTRDKLPVSGVHRGAALVLTDGLLMLMAGMGSLYAFADAYSITLSGDPILSCFLAFLGFTIVFSLPRYRWIILLLFGGGAGWVLWKQRQLLADGAYAIWSDISAVLARWFDMDVVKLSSALSFPEWQAARRAFLSMAVVLFAVVVGWAIVRLHSTLLTVALTLTPLLPALLVGVIPSWPALMTLACCWLTLLLTTLLRHRSQEGAGRFAVLVLPVCALFLVLISALFPQDTYTHPQWAADAYTRLTDLGVRLSDRLFSEESAAPGTGAGTAAAASATVDLGGAGPLQYTGKTVLRIAVEVPGRVYLKGFSTAVYRENSWRQLASNVYHQFSAASDIDWADISQPAYFPFFTNALSAAPYRIEVENVAASDDLVYFPSQLVPGSQDASIKNASFVEDICLTPENDARSHTFYYYRPDDLLRGSELRAQEAHQAENLYRDFAARQYLGVPDGFEDAIASWWEDAQPLYEAYSPSVSAIPELYRQRIAAAWTVAYLLDQTAQYDAQSAAVPAGEDFVCYFLTQSRRGYCMHFASAATLLLRSIGIPARYVSGYAITADQPGTIEAPDSAAHAWVEIYLDGYGWHPVEVTPAAGIDVPLPVPDETGGQTEPVATEEDDPEAPADEEPDDEKPAVSDEAAQSPAREPAHWLFGAVFLLAAVVLLVARRFAVLWLRKRRIHSPDINRSVLVAYNWLQDLCKWGAQTTPDVEELARKAKFSNHTLTEAEREVVLRQLVQEAERIGKQLPFYKKLAYQYIFVLY